MDDRVLFFLQNYLRLPKSATAADIVIGTAPHLLLVTGNKVIAGVVVTGDNCSPVSLSPAIKLSPVSLSSALNCSPVSTTPKIRDKD
jgi:hypothetical protein